MRKAVIILLALISLLYSQPEKKKFNQFNTVSFEHHLKEENGKYNLFISFRIPYSKIVFIKSENKFIAGFTVTIEARDTSDNFVRESVRGKIIANSYEETTNRLKFYQGILKLVLEPKLYKVEPEFYSDYTNNSIKFNSFLVDLKKKNDCEIFYLYRDSLNIYHLANIGNRIPYSSKKYDMIFFSKDKNDKLVEIYNGNKEVLSDTVRSSKKGSFNLVRKNNDILFKETPGEMNRFELDYINKKLNEGQYRFKISNVNSGEVIFDEYVAVYWLDKPLFLKLGEPAGKILNLITEEKNVDFILDDDKLMYQRLIEFWKDYDEDTTTAFNELMEEFYRRADYALEHFSNRTQPNGAFTDRGKVLIVYGEPDKIERNYSDRYKIIEIWHYDKIDKEFMFVDNEGLGNYKLVK